MTDMEALQCRCVPEPESNEGDIGEGERVELELFRWTLIVER